MASTPNNTASSAMERLRALNPQLPEGVFQSMSTPSGYIQNATPVGYSNLSGFQNAVNPIPRATTNTGSSSSTGTLQERQQQLREQKFALEEAKFKAQQNSKQGRFDEQTALAKQRQQFQEQLAKEKQKAAQQLAQQKQKAAQQASKPKAPPKGGGGGGGKKGGGNTQRSTGKFDQSNSTMGDRSFMDTGTPAGWNKEGGLGRSGLGQSGSGQSGNKWQQQGPRNASEVNQYQNDMAKQNAAAAEKNQAARDRHAAEVARRRKEGTLGNYDETGILPDEEQPKQPKMINAYGDPKNTKMVRANAFFA